LPIERELAAEPGFRSEAAVARKLANFLAIDTNFDEGLPHISTGDVAVWQEFASNPARLSEVAAAIRANIEDGAEGGLEDEDEWDAPEGELLTRIHRRRERNRTLVARKKGAALEATGRLICEACGFDFKERYGDRGEGFIECHHLSAVSTLRPGQRTRLSDLALVCANCHRVIHRGTPWLGLDELRALLAVTTPVRS
jgi:5-methylcytosine-specific restriction protein A